ncbi:uncharacterized protein V6R79_005873 [Siganus canaliculatus]
MMCSNHMSPALQVQTEKILSAAGVGVASSSGGVASRSRGVASSNLPRCPKISQSGGGGVETVRRNKRSLSQLTPQRRAAAQQGAFVEAQNHSVVPQPPHRSLPADQQRPLLPLSPECN